MSTELVWYRSLYWRIGVGLVAFLALMLAAQAGLFVWTTDRIAGSMPATSPRRLAVLVASDLSSALDADPELDLDRYVTDQYAKVVQPFVVLMRDGREVSNRPDAIPDDVRGALRVEMARGELPRRGRVFVPRGGRDGDGPIGVPGFRLGEFAAVFSDGVPVGTVAVLIGRPPFGPILREMAPTLALVGGMVLVAGSALIALFVFAPARKRLKLLEHATVQFGSGNLSARAPENGGDEVAALARSFNQMGAELARRADALTAADTARRQLLADVSHELLTPLTAMRGYLETLQMPDLPLDQPTRDRYLGIVSDETHRLEHIVEDLLDLARLEGGGTKMKREPVSVGALFERVLARHEGQARSRTVTLDAQVEPGGEQLEGDPDRLEQALQNLAANAMRHTPDGGTVRLQSTRLPGGLVRLRVRDTGSGIPDAHLPLIFDRFYKADASRKATGGSGLGLSIVKAIVERHGGTIAASNDNGAVFDLVLPVTDTTVSPSGDEPRPTA